MRTGGAGAVCPRRRFLQHQGLPCLHERTLEARKNSEKLCFELFAGAKIE